MSKRFKYSEPKANMSSLSSPVGDGMAVNPSPEGTVPQDMPQQTVVIEGQPNGAEESTEENEDDIQMPELTPIPVFHSNESAEEEEEDLNNLPELLPIPLRTTIHENTDFPEFQIISYQRRWHPLEWIQIEE